MQDVGALAADRPVQLGDPEPGPRLSLRARRSAGDDTLSVGQAAKAGVQMLRVGDQAAVGIAQQVRHAAVDRHDRPGSPLRLGPLLLTLDRHEPLINLAGERAALRVPTSGRCRIARIVPSFGKATPPAVTRKMRGCGSVMATGSRPSSSTGAGGQSLEAPLPRGIELHEHLRADVTGHIGQPRDLRPQLGQLVDLVEGRGQAIPARQIQAPLFVATFHNARSAPSQARRRASCSGVG